MTESAVATPLQRRMSQLSLAIAGGVAVLCIVVLVLGLLRGQPWEPMLLTAVSLAVAAVPESLPAVVAITLALAARRMAARHAVVRRLAAVETLGSVTLLATDKTGTLTEGSMRVGEVWIAPGRDPRELWEAVTLCNDAEWRHPIMWGTPNPCRAAVTAIPWRSPCSQRPSIEIWTSPPCGEHGSAPASSRSTGSDVR